MFSALYLRRKACRQSLRDCRWTRRAGADLPRHSRQGGSPVTPSLLILIGIVVMTLALLVSMAGKEEVVEAYRPPPPAPMTVAPAIEPAPADEGPGQCPEVTPDMGFISIDSDKPANVYVGCKWSGSLRL